MKTRTLSPLGYWVFGGLVLTMVVWKFVSWVNAPSATASIPPPNRGDFNRPPVQTASVEPENRCDNVYRSRTLTQVPTLVTGSVGCVADWNIVEGGVIVFNEKGEAFPRAITKEQPMGISNFRIVRWKSEGQTALVDVKLR